MSLRSVIFIKRPDIRRHPIDPIDTLECSFGMRMQPGRIEQHLSPSKTVMADPQDQIYPDHIFWTLSMSWTLDNGIIVDGINADLVRQYPELEDIMSLFLQECEQTDVSAPNTTSNSFNFDVDVNDSHNSFQPDGITTDMITAVGNTMAPAPVPSSHGQDSEHSTYPSIKKEAAPAPSPAVQRLPEYVIDFADANAARMYLAHPDPEDCQTLSIPDDDLTAVQANQQHHFAKLLLEAIATPGLLDLPAEQFGDKNKLLQKFRGQQNSTMVKITNEMSTAAQQKTARANCLLAVDAAIFVSKHGIPKHLYNAALTNSSSVKAKRKAHADMRSKCSDRLEAMVAVVRDYKLAALDVLTGKNTHRFAYDPKFYAEEKLQYLLSNVQRQENAEAVQAAKPELGMRKLVKRKQRDGEEVEDSNKRIKL
ncbi:hypothetical protein EJ03DRAFT_381349 [Teratosphaeria nubilosa]|uniref:Uncharacterized protein n=1 Tax=Teratosphaeria nubilosa TaxID=161662 RepID=A0A6G1LFV3_9PEZI|nr:hypothetical protein EJ03DRAFT_381349 [Teratosphaeria nubilosa]